MEYSDKAIPVVNRNGDAAKTLTDQYRAAYIAVGEAIKVVCKAAPHGRNYQADHVEFREAQDEHRAHLTMLNDMQARYLELYTNVTKQA